MSFVQEIREDEMINIVSSVARVLNQESVSLGDVINLFCLLDLRADEIRRGMRRHLAELWMMVPRPWDLHGCLSDATILKYLKTRSRPSSGRVGDGEGIICVVCQDELHCHDDDEPQRCPDDGNGNGNGGGGGSGGGYI
ncbi:hypothetical protein Salat_0018900 [Sesamum alatum]|uniref:Uncharacterized protein n=1 Tax=Sesamum alatum TaxID=300844 RepID=A0AAE2CWA2_9LAMI|nr:hypothetical protein Salat_0018900 [Sesamum alatum]